MYKKFFKRVIDMVASGLGLLVLSPVLIIVSIWLHFANKGAGVIFTQDRPGKNGKIFKLYKFKSMTDEKGADGQFLPDAQRLTKPGRIVRSTSLDELPQLWNVFKGEMSLIGPRPLLPRYLPYYTQEEFHRHDVRPGITGWAQVNGRNHTTWEELFEHDLEYVRNISFLMDCKIIFMTIKNVIKKSDIDVAPKGDYLDVERKDWKI